MGATSARERAIADSQFGGGATTWAPANWYVGLSTTTPANDGTGFTEPSGNAYARVTMVNNATNFPPATTADGITKKANGTKITWPNPTGPWGTLIQYGFFTTLTGGQPEWTGALDAPVSPRAGNTPVEYDVAQLVVTFD